MTDDGFEFQVPVSETAGAVMLAEDKALYFMRHIVRHLKMLDRARQSENENELGAVAEATA